MQAANQLESRRKDSRYSPYPACQPNFSTTNIHSNYLSTSSLDEWNNSLDFNHPIPSTFTNNVSSPQSLQYLESLLTSMPEASYIGVPTGLEKSTAIPMTHQQLGDVNSTQLSYTIPSPSIHHQIVPPVPSSPQALNLVDPETNRQLPQSPFNYTTNTPLPARPPSTRHASEPYELLEASAASRPGKETFVMKLYNLVSDPNTDNFIWWSDDGEKFYFKESDQYTTYQVTRSNNIQSFIRQLNSYGFGKVQLSFQTKTDKGKRNEKLEIEPYCFWHPHFQRDHQELLQTINRKEGARTVANRLRLEIQPPSPSFTDTFGQPSSGSPITPVGQGSYYLAPQIAITPNSSQLFNFPGIEPRVPGIATINPPPSPLTTEWVYSALIQERDRAFQAEQFLTQRLKQLESAVDQLRLHFSG